MWWTRRHLSDAELLLLDEDEGEPWPRWSGRGRAHLARCGSCLARQRTLTKTMRSVARLYREEQEPQPAMALPSGSPVTSLRWGVAIPGVLLVALALFTGARVWPSGDPGARLPPDAGPILPRPDLTPGSARPISLNEVCGHEPLRLGPRVGDGVPRQVFETYGADFSRADEYELDFLITPELGGTAETGNLWPQSFVSTEWNAYVKDELERRLQEMVCDGRMDVATAQRRLAADWIAAYKQFFNTDRPLRGHGFGPSGSNARDVLYSEALERQLLPGV